MKRTRPEARRPRIRVVAPPHLVEGYQRLLLSDYSYQSALSACALIRQTLSLSGSSVEFSWEREARIKAQREKTKATIVAPNAAEYVREFLGVLDSEATIPDELPTRKGQQVQLAHHVQEAGVFLLAQRQLELSGAVHFLRDLQSQLYLHSLHGLAPELRRGRMRKELDLLHQILWVHTKLVWDDNPAHKFFLLSELHLAAGDIDKAKDALLASFRLTERVEHDWITKAQSYWSVLIETEDYDGARDFILRVLRQAPFEHFQELVEMVDDTYALRSEAWDAG